MTMPKLKAPSEILKFFELPLSLKGCFKYILFTIFKLEYPAPPYIRSLSNLPLINLYFLKTFMLKISL